MDVQITEARGQCALLQRLQLLALEEQHMVLQQGGEQIVALGIAEAVRQLQAADQGADGRAQGLHADGGCGHPLSPSLIF